MHRRWQKPVAGARKRTFPSSVRGGAETRHYCDLYMLMRDAVGEAAMTDAPLGADCVAHARLFFDRPDFDLASAQPPTFALSPDRAMYDHLRRDYALMRPMIFGEAPSFETVLESVFALERRLNGLD